MPCIRDKTTTLRMGHLLESLALAPKILAVIAVGVAREGLMLKTGTVVDATIIAALSPTKIGDGEHDPEMHQTTGATCGTWP